jgi:hypothetical protein
MNVHRAGAGSRYRPLSATVSVKPQFGWFTTDVLFGDFAANVSGDQRKREVSETNDLRSRSVLMITDLRSRLIFFSDFFTRSCSLSSFAFASA